MNPSKSQQRKEKLKRFSHILAGLIIMFHSYERYESGHKTYFYFVVAGIVILSLALFHHQLKSKFPWIDNCFFVVEAVLSFIVAYEYFHMGKTGLPLMYLFAGLFQLCAIYFFSKRRKRQAA